MYENSVYQITIQPDNKTMYKDKQLVIQTYLGSHLALSLSTKFNTLHCGNNFIRQ